MDTAMRYLDLILENVVKDEDIFSIPTVNIGFLKDKIEELNKKGAKIGAEPIIVREVGEVKQNVNGVSKSFTKVQVFGKAPKIEGWQLVAALDHEDGANILRVVPGEELPQEFRNSSPSRCDHCNTKRDRVKSYIVKDEQGVHKQVGRSCVKNFLGLGDPMKILGMASILDVLDEIIKVSSNEEFSGGREASVINLKAFLSYVSASIKKFGWISKAAASDYGKISTAEAALMSMFPYPSTSKDEMALPTEQDDKIAEDTLEWIRGDLANKDHKSDYEHNLVTIASGDYVKRNLLGFAASMIPAHNRAQEKERQSKDAPTSEFVGEVGQRFGAKGLPPLELQLLGVRWIDTQYGTTGIHRFIDKSGNFFVWFASSDPKLEVNNWYKVSASIKNHGVDKYNNNQKTTYLTRIKVV